jgi:hypothetical protein
MRRRGGKKLEGKSRQDATAVALSNNERTSGMFAAGGHWTAAGRALHTRTREQLSTVYPGIFNHVKGDTFHG